MISRFYFIVLATATALLLPASAVAQNNYSRGNSPTAFEIARNQDSAALAFGPDSYRNLPRRSVHRLKRAAERGDTDAMVRLGLMKISGRSVPEDEIGGWTLLLKAADAGHAQASLIVALRLCAEPTFEATSKKQSIGFCKQ